MAVRSHSGTVIADEYERVVYGDRGAYVEIADEHINRIVLMIPSHAEWRSTPLWLGRVYYIEHRTIDKSWLKVYEQRRVVGYADYRIGFWYVSASKVEIA